MDTFPEKYLLATTTATLWVSECDMIFCSLEYLASRNHLWIYPSQNIILDVIIRQGYKAISSVDEQAIVSSVQSMLSDVGLLVSLNLSKAVLNSPSATTTHISLSLRESLDQSPRILRGRIPRSVRVIDTADPQPPVGIKKARLIKLELTIDFFDCVLSPRFLPCPCPSAEDSGIVHVDHDSVKDEFPLLIHSECSTLNGEPFIMGEPGMPCNYQDEQTETYDKHLWTSHLIHYIVRSLLSGPTKDYEPNGIIESQMVALPDIAPTIFRPNHRDNIRHRAGFLPAAARSIETMLRLTSSPALKQLLDAVKDSTRERFQLHVGPDNHDNLRLLIKCILWTSLQRWEYKDREVKRDELQESAIEDGSSMLDEPSDLEQEQAGLASLLEDATNQSVVGVNEIVERRTWLDCSSSSYCGFARSETGTAVPSVSEPDLDGESIKLKSEPDELILGQDAMVSNAELSPKSVLTDLPLNMIQGPIVSHFACPWSELSANSYSPLIDDTNSVRPPSEHSSGQQEFPDETEDVEVFNSDVDIFFEE